MEFACLHEFQQRVLFSLGVYMYVLVEECNHSAMERGRKTGLEILKYAYVCMYVRTYVYVRMYASMYVYEMNWSGC